TSTGALFSWDSMPGATSYKLEISRFQAFTSVIGTYYPQNTSYAPTLATTDYLNGGTFYWRVSSKDGDGNIGTYTGAQTMTSPTKMSATVSPGILLHGKTTTVTVTIKSFDNHPVAGAKVAYAGAGLHASYKLTGSTVKVVFKLRPTRAGTITFTVSKANFITFKKTATSR